MVGYRSLAAGAALALIFGASAAQAGSPLATTLNMTPNPANAGQTVTLEATVASSSMGCTGSVDFKNSVTNTSLCSAGLTVMNPNSSVASCAITPAAGTYNVQAHATGTCTISSAIIPLTVNAAPAAVPTVGEWTMWGLAGLLLIGGGAVASRRFNVARGI